MRAMSGSASPQGPRSDPRVLVGTAELVREVVRFALRGVQVEESGKEEGDLQFWRPLGNGQHMDSELGMTAAVRYCVRTLKPRPNLFRQRTWATHDGN